MPKNNKINDGFLKKLYSEIKLKSENFEPHKSYSAYLTSLGAESIGKKLIEEVFELSVANIEFEKFPEKRSAVIYEAADVVYHMLALLVSRKIEFSEIIAELEKRNNNKSDVMISAKTKSKSIKSKI